MSLVLYSYKESGNSYKVRLLLSFLHLKAEIKELDFFADEQHSPEFLKINPKGEVPALVDGDVVLTDSAAILTYLAGKYGPKNTWWSEDIVEQAKIVDWLAFAASWVQYGVFTARAILSFKGPYNGLGLASTEQTLSEAKIRGHKSLEILNRVLSERQWLANDRATIADIAVFVYVALAPMGDISLEPYAHVRAWIERIKALPDLIAIDGLDDPLYRRKAS